MTRGREGVLRSANFKLTRPIEDEGWVWRFAVASCETCVKMKFSIGECEVMHVRERSLNLTCKMLGSELTIPTQEEGPGPWQPVPWKHQLNAQHLSKKANITVGINQERSWRPELASTALGVSLVHPALEHSAWFWPPSQKGFRRAEEVQRRTMGANKGLERLPYGEQLSNLESCSLRKTWLRGIWKRSIEPWVTWSLKISNSPFL